MYEFTDQPTSIGVDLSSRDDMSGFAIAVDGEVIAHATSQDAAERIADALNSCPLQSFERALAIGERLHARWTIMAGGEAPPLAQNDLAWADMVQFIVRMAREPGDLPRLTSDDPAPEGVRANYADEAPPAPDAAQQGS